MCVCVCLCVFCVLQDSEERLDARKLVNAFQAKEYVGQRHNWMVILAPEEPVAGEDCLVLFNRLQSEPLA